MKFITIFRIDSEIEFIKNFYFNNKDIFSSFGKLETKTDLTNHQIEFHRKMLDILYIPMGKIIEKMTKMMKNEKLTEGDIKELSKIENEILDFAKQRTFRNSKDLEFFKKMDR